MRSFRSPASCCWALAGSLAIAGCSSGAPAPRPPHAARPAPSPAASPAARLAVAAYTGMWAQMQAAGVTADWKDPALARYASGQALSTLVAGLRKARGQGIVIRGTIVTHPRVVAVSPAARPDRVLVSDCVDDTRWLNYVAATGKLQDNVPGAHHLTQAAVTRRAGRWTVSRLAVQGPGTC